MCAVVRLLKDNINKHICFLSIRLCFAAGLFCQCIFLKYFKKVYNNIHKVTLYDIF